MTRVLTLLCLLVCSGLAGACSADERSRVQQTLERAARATQGVGMQVTTTGTLSADGLEQALRSRATIAADGRRARIRTQIGGQELVQYVDGTSMLMSVDSFPVRSAWPPGTRFLRVDLDRIGSAMGLDSALRDLQSLDPARAAALLAKVADDVQPAGRGTLGGVAVQRYSARLHVDKLMESVVGKDAAGGLPAAVKDATMTVEVAIDGKDRIRGFGIDGALGQAAITLRAQVTAFDRDIEVAVPTTGVYDITAALAGMAGALSPAGP